MVPPVSHTNLTISFPGRMVGLSGLLSRVVFWIMKPGGIKQNPPSVAGPAPPGEREKHSSPGENPQNPKHFRIVVPLARPADAANALELLANHRHREGLEIELFSKNDRADLLPAVSTLRERLAELGLTCRSARATGVIDFFTEVRNFAQWVQADLILRLSRPTQSKKPPGSTAGLRENKKSPWPEKPIALSSPLLSPP